MMQKLGLLSGKFRIIMIITMLMAEVEKVNSMHDQMGQASREVKINKKHKMQMVEIKKKHSKRDDDGLAVSLDNKTEIPRTVGQYQMLHCRCNGNLRKWGHRETKGMVESIMTDIFPKLMTDTKPKIQLDTQTKEHQV